MFGTQIDDPVTMTTPPKADSVVTGAKIYGLQIGEIWLPVDSPGASRFKSVDSCFTIILTPNPAHLHSNDIVVKEGSQLINLAVDGCLLAMSGLEEITNSNITMS